MAFSVDDYLFPVEIRERDWHWRVFAGPERRLGSVVLALLAKVGAVRLPGRRVLFVVKLTPRASRGKAIRIGLRGAGEEIAYESARGSDDLTLRRPSTGESRLAGKLVDDAPVELGFLCDVTQTEVQVNRQQAGVLDNTVAENVPLDVIEDVLDAGDVEGILVAWYKAVKTDPRGR